jgi:hypothetical protein
MSRLTTMSPEAIKAVFSPDADADLIFLLTIYNPASPSQVVARLADGFTQRISETDTDVIYGVKSNGSDFIFLPMEIGLPTEEEAQAPRCSITLHDVTRYVTPIIRTITAPPPIKMELVLSKTPNIVEVSFDGFYINSFTYNANSVTASLSMIDLEREPFPAHSFTPRYFPGMF